MTLWSVLDSGGHGHAAHRRHRQRGILARRRAKSIAAWRDGQEGFFALLAPG